MRKFRLTLTTLAALVVLVTPLSALASTYGSGSYTKCAYSQGCTSSGAPKSSSAGADTTAPAADSIILLNDFSPYFTDDGKTLDLKAGQVVYFDVTVDGTSQRHSVTIKSVGETSVDIEVNSTPIEATISLAQSKQFDVTGDNTNDIKITLNSITEGVASMTFFALTPAARTTPTTTSSPDSNVHHNWWIWIIVFSICLIAGIWWFLFLAKRRRDRKNQPTTTSPQ